MIARGLPRYGVAFARSEEQIHFQPVLARIHIPVAAAQRVELMRAALHNLVPPQSPESDRPAGSSTTGARSQRSCAPASGSKPLLNHRFRFGIEDSTSPRPESEYAGRPESPARSRAAAAGRPKASRRARPQSSRTVRETSPRTHPRAQSGTLRSNSSSVASGREKSTFSRIDAVKEERLLQHHSQWRAIAGQLHIGQIDAIHQNSARIRLMKRRRSAPMMVDLPDPDEPTSAVTVPGCDSKRNAMQHRLAGIVGELTSSNSTIAPNLGQT